MDLGRPSLRLLALFGAVALPPLVALAALLTFEAGWVEEVGMGTALLVAAAGAAIWAVLLAVVGSRVLARDLREMLDLAERGAPNAPGQGDDSAEVLSSAQRRLAAALDERNRQIASLAAEVSAAPITGTAADVAANVVAIARRVTRDPTWQLAVLQSSDDALLRPGVYDDDPQSSPAPVADLHRWGSVTDQETDGGETRRGRHAIGPWGAFTIVDASASEELSAILIAPWEGRAAPTPAEMSLFSLLGQQAATAIEHALLYARVRAQADELNRLAAIQTDFLRGVTHDLQTPLTSIRALASELRQAAALDEAARADLDTIAHQADRLRRMVSQLLVASRLEVGAVTPSQEVFRVQPLVERTWDALRADRPFELTVDGAPHLVVADPDRLEQVLWAVLDNAVKYSPMRTPIAVRISGRPDAAAGLSSVIEIRDEGSGMDATTVDRAFEQFYRSDQARRLAPDGSGVGLYAARGLVGAMGGSIDIESRLGSGTRLTITLPGEALAEAMARPQG